MPGDQTPLSSPAIKPILRTMRAAGGFLVRDSSHHETIPPYSFASDGHPGAGNILPPGMDCPRLVPVTRTDLKLPEGILAGGRLEQAVSAKKSPGRQPP